MASQSEISKRIAREITRGHDPKQAAAIAYSELGEDMSPEDWDGLVGGLLKFFSEEEEEPDHAQDASCPMAGILDMLMDKVDDDTFAQVAVALNNLYKA